MSIRHQRSWITTEKYPSVGVREIREGFKRQFRKNTCVSVLRMLTTFWLQFICLYPRKYSQDIDSLISTRRRLYHSSPKLRASNFRRFILIREVEQLEEIGRETKFSRGRRWEVGSFREYFVRHEKAGKRVRKTYCLCAEGSQNKELEANGNLIIVPFTSCITGAEKRSFLGIVRRTRNW